MADEILQKIIERERTLGPLYKRMDTDLSLYHLESFTMKDSKGKDRPNVDNVTLNDPQTFASRVIYILGTANRRFSVTEVDNDSQADIEKFLKLLFEINDYYLSVGVEDPFDFSVNWSTAIRGWIGGLALYMKDGEKEIPMIRALDTRYMAWEANQWGLNWGSYRSMMSKSGVETVYKKKIKASTANVINYWDAEKTIAYVDGEKVQEVTHGLGINPLFVVPAPTEPFISDANGIKYRGESIYTSNRVIYDKLNDMVSTWSTTNKMGFLPPMQFISPLNRKWGSTVPYGISQVISLQAGEEFKAMPIRDIAPSAEVLFGQMAARSQRGGLPFVDYGELSFELSAVAISKLTESRDQVFVPRLRAKMNAYRQVIQILRHQATNKPYNTDFPEATPFYVKARAPLLKKDFQIGVEFYAQSPEQNIANYTVAQVAQSLGIPDVVIYRDILKFEDPEGVLARRDIQIAEHESPSLRKFNGVLKLIKLGENAKGEEKDVYNAKAWLLYNEMTAQEQQALSAVENIEAQQKQAPSQPNRLMPKLPSMAGGAMVREKARRQGIPTERAGANEK